MGRPGAHLDWRPVERSKHLAVGAVLVGLLVPPAATAAGGATFSITPMSRAPYFVFDSRPGAVIRGQVRVVNVSSVAGQAKLYAVDATTGQTSGAVYQSETSPRRDVGAWITLSASTVSLGPHQGAAVSFSVQVPASTRGGQHLGGLVVAPIKPTGTSTGTSGAHTFRVNIQEIAIVAVQVNLPGALTPRLAITGVRASGRPGYQTVLIGLTNTGNSLVKGSGTLQISQAGRTVLSQAFALDTMVPQTSIDYPVYVRGRRLAPGSFVAGVTLHYAGGRTSRATLPFTVSTQQVRQTFGSTVPPGAPAGVAAHGSSSSVPVWAIGLGAAALVALSVGGSALFFRRRSA
jgi:hypothetical protein